MTRTRLDDDRDGCASRHNLMNSRERGAGFAVMLVVLLVLLGRPCVFRL